MDISTDLLQTLTSIGLLENEAKVYLTLLTLGNATAYEVAQECDVKKPTVYVTLEDMRRRGLVLKVPHAKKAVYAPRDIEEFLQEKEEKLRSVRRALPKLRSLETAQRANVLYFKEIRGINEAVNYKLTGMKGKTFCSFYGNLEGCGEEIKALFSRWDQKVVDAGIATRIVMQKKDADRYYKDLVSLAKYAPIEIRFLEKYEYPANISFEIGEDFVRIIDAKNLYATILDDANTALAFRQIFEIVWEKGA